MVQQQKILIVDDEPSILLSLDFLMRKNDYGVFIARNGAEAIQILDQEKPDLVLLDIMMPEVDGYEVCEYIRNNKALTNMGIIFLTAKSKDEDIDKAYRLGADLYITKPFSTKNLLEKIKEIIELKAKE